MISLLNDSVPKEPNAIRLMNGHNSTSGRVEVSHEGRWGIVIYPDTSQGPRIAGIVCRQLGLQGRNFDSYTLPAKRELLH